MWSPLLSGRFFHLDQFSMYIGFIKTLATIFRRNTTTPGAHLLPSPTDDNWCHQRVCDLTGQLFNVPQYATASGGYSDVWKCDLIKDGTIVKVAAKTIRRQGGNNDDTLRKALKRGKRELDVWMILQHDHVLPLYGVVHDFPPGTTAMVCPWLENGTVTTFIDSHRDLSGNHRLQLISDVAAGLRYLHSQSIVHGDLTGSNILVCAQGRAYLADFGLSAILAEYNVASHSLTCAARWAAPELITYPMDIPDLLSLQSDMYSFGSIMFHILSGVIPYHELPNHRVIAGIVRGEKPPRPEHPRIIDGHWDFIQRCWLPAQRRFSRPSADDACKFLQCQAPDLTQ